MSVRFIWYWIWRVVSVVSGAKVVSFRLFRSFLACLLSLSLSFLLHQRQLFSAWFVECGCTTIHEAMTARRCQVSSHAKGKGREREEAESARKKETKTNDDRTMGGVCVCVCSYLAVLYLLDSAACCRLRTPNCRAGIATPTMAVVRINSSLYHRV